MPRRRETAVNLSNLNAKPLRFLMADKSVSPRSLAIWPHPVGNERERQKGKKKPVSRGKEKEQGRTTEQRSSGERRFSLDAFNEVHRQSGEWESDTGNDEERRRIRKMGDEERSSRQEREREREEKREDSELISLLAVARLNCLRPPAFLHHLLPFDLVLCLLPPPALLSNHGEPEVEQFIPVRFFF